MLGVIDDVALGGRRLAIVPASRIDFALIEVAFVGLIGDPGLRRETERQICRRSPEAKSGFERRELDRIHCGNSAGHMRESHSLAVRGGGAQPASRTAVAQSSGCVRRMPDLE